MSTPPTPESILAARNATRALWLDGMTFGDPHSHNGRKEITVFLADMRLDAPLLRIRESYNHDGRWDVEEYHAKEKNQWDKWQRAEPGATGLPLDAAKAIAGRIAHGYPKPTGLRADYNTGGAPLKREAPIDRMPHGTDMFAGSRQRVSKHRDNPEALFGPGVLTIRPATPEGVSVEITGEHSTMATATRSRKSAGSKEAKLREQREIESGTPGAEQPKDDAEAREVAEALAADQGALNSSDVSEDGAEHPAELSDAAVRAIHAAVADSESAESTTGEGEGETSDPPVAQVWAYVAGESGEDAEAHRIENADGESAETACGQSITIGAVARGSYAVCAYCADGTKKPADAPRAAPLRASVAPESVHGALITSLNAGLDVVLKALAAAPNTTDARAVYDLLSKAVAEVRPMLPKARTAATRAEGGTVRVRNASPLKQPVRYTNPTGETKDLTCAQAAKAAADDYGAPACASYKAKCETQSLNARLFLRKDLKDGKLDPAKVVLLDEQPAESAPESEEKVSD
jgi:hypothetical protein